MFKLDIQLFAAEGEGETNTDTNSTASDKQEKTFTQSELDNIIKERLGRNKASVLKELGIEDVSAFKAQQEEFKKYQDSQKTDMEKLQAELDKYKEEANTYKTQVSTRELHDAANTVLKDLVEEKRYKAVIKLTDLSDVRKEDGSIDEKKLKQALETTIKEYDLPTLEEAPNKRFKVGGDAEKQKQDTNPTDERYAAMRRRMGLAD